MRRWDSAYRRARVSFGLADSRPLAVYAQELDEFGSDVNLRCRMGIRGKLIVGIYPGNAVGLLCMGMLSVAVGCSTAKIYSVERATLSPPAKVTFEDLRSGIVAGAEAWGWRVETVDRNRIQATYRSRRGRHWASAEVGFDRDHFTIRYLDSSPSLDADLRNGRIHEIYNVWVRQLEFAVATGALFFATPYRTIAGFRQPPEWPKEVTGRVFERDFLPGREASAFTGDTMIRVKDYYVVYDEISDAVAEHRWQVQGFLDGERSIPVDIALERGASYRVIGSFRDRDGSMRFLVEIPASLRAFWLVVDANGHLASDHFVALQAPTADSPDSQWEMSPNWEVRLYRIEPHPALPGRMFQLDGSPSEVRTKPGYINYELVYSGTNGEQINILYREFSPGNLARPAFSQHLVYRTDQETIRFRGLRIDVVSASNEEIVFRVVEDPHRDYLVPKER